jgi:hypothetical protein
MDINDLVQLSKTLNTSTDELNAQLKDVEDRINALSLGVEAWVTNKPLREEFTASSSPYGHPTRGRIATELGYARFNEGWKLAVRTVSYSQWLDLNTEVAWEESTDGRGMEVSGFETKPLLRAGRTLRTAAVDRIPDLVEALHAAGSKVAEAVEKARKLSESLK